MPGWGGIASAPPFLAVRSTITQGSLDSRIEALQPLRCAEVELVGLPSAPECNDQRVNWN